MSCISPVLVSSPSTPNKEPTKSRNSTLWTWSIHRNKTLNSCNLPFNFRYDKEMFHRHKNIEELRDEYAAERVELAAILEDLVNIT